MESVTRQAEAFMYIPESDRAKPPEEQTRIVLNPLTADERNRAFDEEDVVQQHVGDLTRELRSRRWRMHRELARGHIVSVENFPREKPVPFPSGGTRAEKESYLDQMPDSEVYLIGLELRVRSEMKKDTGN